jgi:hypothetical protein
VGVLTAGSAKALVVNVDGEDWDLTTFKGDYIANIGKFNVDEMPWFGNPTLATEFAAAVEGSLNYPNSGIFPFLTAPRILGPFFGWQTTGGSYIQSAAWEVDEECINGCSVFINQGYQGSFTYFDQLTWAQASRVPASVPASVPGPLPALGVAAAFGFSRKLRSRIKKSGNSASSTYTV